MIKCEMAVKLPHKIYMNKRQLIECTSATAYMIEEKFKDAAIVLASDIIDNDIIISLYVDGKRRGKFHVQRQTAYEWSEL